MTNVMHDVDARLSHFRSPSCGRNNEHVVQQTLFFCLSPVLSCEGRTLLQTCSSWKCKLLKSDMPWREMLAGEDQDFNEDAARQTSHLQSSPCSWDMLRDSGRQPLKTTDKRSKTPKGNVAWQTRHLKPGP